MLTFHSHVLGTKYERFLLISLGVRPLNTASKIRARAWIEGVVGDLVWGGVACERAITDYDIIMKLPNPEDAIVDEQKLSGYSLNPNHADGRHKARVFKSALNLDISNIAELKAALLEAVKIYDATPDKRNQYGQKYVINFPMNHINKTATIHSVWIVKNGENFPRLVTCYIL